MRILMISDFYPPAIGGMERHVQTLSRELVRRGHHVAVATLWCAGSSVVEDDEGVQIYRLTGWNQALTPFYQDQSHPFHPPLPDPKIVVGLRRVIEQEQPDIVHARRWMLYSFIGLKKWSKAKVVVTLHDYSLLCPKMTYLDSNNKVCTGSSYIKCINCASSHYGKGKALLLTSGLKISSYQHRYVDKYIAVSSAVRDVCIAETGNPPKRIEVVPSFIPDNSVPEASNIERPAFLPSQDNYILFVGRQGSSKGLNVLLEAYAGLSDLAPLVLMLTDHGDNLMQFPAGVRAMYNVPHAQVMEGWMHCAVGVVPSVWPEPFGQVAVEAMACGKPVIASAIGGLSDIVLDGVSGLLVEPSNVNALQRALRMLLLDPAKRKEMGMAGRQRAHLFTVSTVANRIEEIYTELLSENSVCS